MSFTLATSIVALAVLTAAVPQPVGEGSGIAIPIAKRSGLTNADGVVSTEALNSHVASTQAYVVFILCFASTQIFLRSKVLEGFKNYQKNTGTAHPAALPGTQIQRRETGADPLTNQDSTLWYGSVSVGAPPVTFTGKFSYTFNERTTHTFLQWISTQVRGMFL